MNRFIFIFILIIFINFSCANDAKNAQNAQNTTQNTTNVSKYSTLATEYCTCSADLVALNKKAKHLATHPEEVKNPEEMSDLLAQSEQFLQKQIECQNKLEQQFQTKIADNMEILLAIRQICPDLADFMENAKKNDD